MATAEDNFRLLVAPADYGSELPRVRFLAAVAAHGLVHVRHDSFRGAIDAAAAATVGRPELVRTSARGDTLEAFVWLDGGLPCLLDGCHGTITVEVAGRDSEAIAAALATLRARLHRPEPPPAVVQFAFWSAAPRGGAVRHRDIAAPGWAAVRGNYTARAARALDALIELREPRRGRLVIWRGPPGTGKTWALRALAAAWRDWCAAHYVLDPHALLHSDPRYLLDVLTYEDEQPWRLVVLEDAGELIAHDAGRTGALAVLLNVTDGLLGHGTGTIVLITTNEPVAQLHPAVRRRGRCLADIEFGPLSQEEAREWLLRAGSDREPAGPLTLAELFALADGAAAADEPVAPAAPFGFSRALGR